jgi:hypothetical protein
MATSLSPHQVIGTDLFLKGISAGIRGKDGRFDLSSYQIDEMTIVGIIDNLCCLAKANELTTARLVYDSGLIVGVVATRLERR